MKGVGIIILFSMVVGSFNGVFGNGSTTGTLYIAMRTLSTDVNNHIQYFVYDNEDAALALISGFVASTAELQTGCSHYFDLQGLISAPVDCGAVPALTLSGTHISTLWYLSVNVDPLVPQPCSNTNKPCGDGSMCTALSAISPYLVTCNCGGGYRQNYTLIAGESAPLLADGTQTTCEDIDECSGNATVCGMYTDTCHNFPGTYNCTCQAGFMLVDGNRCIENNECYYLPCDVNSFCSNSSGSYECECNPGYSGNGTVCWDMDECQSMGCMCQANSMCVNTPGNYTCTCMAGYEGDQNNCTDIDECTRGTHTCPANSNCINNMGSYDCICKDGYSGDRTNCTDINECSQPRTCNPHADCTNTEGSFTCSCHGGFTGNGLYCDDVNECTNGQNNCHGNATCTNHIGDYSCCCNAPFYGNGTFCWGIPENCNKAVGLSGHQGIVMVISLMLLSTGFVLSPSE